MKALVALTMIAAIPLYPQGAADILRQGSEPIRIDIDSSWVGLGTPLKRVVTISGQRGRYVSNNRKVAAKAVEEFLAALHDPVAPQPSLEECGASETWLSTNYVKALEGNTHRKFSQFSPRQIELFKKHFVEPRSAQTAFEELFKYSHTDDYPKILVTVKLGNREYGIQSDSQHPFMLPWHGPDRQRGGYSCRLSRAVAGLVDKGFPNRDRLLLGDDLRGNLAQQVMASIKHDWDLLDTENRVGPEVAPVLDRFEVLKSQISNLSSIDLDGDQSWNAELRASGMPSNFKIGVSLRYHGKALNGVDSLIEDLPRYAALALSVPWLQRYLEEKPQSSAEMRYVNGRSISPKAVQRLHEELQGHGQDASVQAISEHASESVFLEVQDAPGCWSRAVVLPNRETLLWQFQCNSPLRLRSADLKTWDCYGWKCAGALIDPEGRIVK